MKRKGGSVIDQPSLKKPNNVSTDLRSKIGAKLQTLLNSDSRQLSRRHNYEDLFRENEHSEIIIDPTIVVKSETTNSENCTDAQNLESGNFLNWAKSRLTTLMRKTRVENETNSFKDSEKENSRSNYKDCDSSAKSSDLESCSRVSHSYNLLNNPNSSSSQYSDESNCDILISQDLSFIFDGFMKSKDKTSSPCELSSEAVKNSSLNSHISSAGKNNEVNLLNEFNKSVQSNCDNTNNIVPTTNSHGCSVEQSSALNITPNSSRKKSIINTRSKRGSNLSVLRKKSKKACDIIDLEETLISNTKTSKQSSISHRDSEIVDDPGVRKNEKIQSPRSHENTTDVVVLYEKQRTYEVVTLEDAESGDNDDVTIIEPYYLCHHCGKTFRAKFLFNFHLRMHEIDSNDSRACVSDLSNANYSDDK